MGFLNGQKCYFVINRGIRSKLIFRESADHRFFLRLLRQYKHKFTLKIFGFCMLPDSSYIIIQPLNPAQLVDYLKLLTRAYTGYFNKKYENKGRIWNTRYKLFLIDNDAQLFESIKFLEFMPVRCLNVGNPLAYPWSSCCYRIQGDDVGILDKRPIHTTPQVKAVTPTPQSLSIKEHRIAVQEIGDIPFFV